MLCLNKNSDWLEIVTFLGIAKIRVLLAISNQSEFLFKHIIATLL